MYEVKPRPPAVESHVDGAIFNFFVYGCKPGSYTSYMFQHEFFNAKAAAHPLMLEKIMPGVAPHDAYIHVFKNMPEFLIKESFETWPGWINASEEQREQIRESYSDKRVSEYQTYKVLDSKDDRTFKEWIIKADKVLESQEKE